VRASIYARISRDREGAGLGVATQEADCRELARELGWSIVGVHTDNDLSAHSGRRRPGYEALLAQIRAGDTDAVIAWHTDRLHRSPVELEAYVTACEPHGVITQTVKAGHIDLTTASGLMIARMLGATARYEVDQIERSRRAKKRSAEAGKWKGGRRPYGYERDGVTVVPEEANAIATATTALLAGASLRGIAAQWNADGRPTSTGGRWHSNALRVTLMRPRNAGLMEHRGQIIGKAEWEPIVSEAEWRALVDKLADPKRRSNGHGPARRWLGSGLYRCECGVPLICSQANMARIYRCRDGCGKLSRQQKNVDEFITKVIVERLRRPDVASLVAHDRSEEVRVLEAQAVALRARLDSLAGFFAQGLIDAQQLTEGTKEINVSLEAVRAKIGKLYDGSALAGIVDTDDAGSAWLEAPLDRQRAVVDALAVVTLLRGGHGRPAGWRPGRSYFRPELVKIEWKTS
jgi:DNA invertase Pin-like site-specific DNA recombinase